MISKLPRTYDLQENGHIAGYKWFDYSIKEYKGIVVICHGMAEHIDRYDYFSEKLVNAGYIVFGHNQRGHKDTIARDQDYGYMSDNDNFQILVNDLASIIDIIKKEYPSLPIYLFGHSMGSFVSERMIQIYPGKINGLILSGTSKNPQAIVAMGLFISKIIAFFRGPRYRSKLINSMSFGSYNKKFKPNRTESDWLNRNNEEVDKYVNDKYCGGIFTTGYFRDFFRGLNKITKNNKLIEKDLPIFIISGSEDPVGNMGKDVTKLYEIYKELEIKDVTLKLYEGARHEILLENMKEEVISDCISWLNDH